MATPYPTQKTTIWQHAQGALIAAPAKIAVIVNIAIKTAEHVVYVKNQTKSQMKKLFILIILATGALFSRAQTSAMSVADDYFAKKSYANASNYYNQVLTQDSTNVKALRRMGYCTMTLPGEEFLAAGYFYRALHAQPNDPISNYYLGVIYMDQAKQAADAKAKSEFKAKAADYLNKADKYGSVEAKAAIKDLNAI